MAPGLGGRPVLQSCLMLRCASGRGRTDSFGAIAADQSEEERERRGPVYAFRSRLVLRSPFPLDLLGDKGAAPSSLGAPRPGLYDD